MSNDVYEDAYRDLRAAAVRLSVLIDQHCSPETCCLEIITANAALTDVLLSYDAVVTFPVADSPPGSQDISLDLDVIASLIEDEHRYEQASSLCLLSLAGSAERVAAALEARS